MRRVAAVSVLAVLMGSTSFGQSQRGLSELSAGKAAARAGRYDDAILALESAIEALRDTPKRKRAVAEAHVYLGMAQLGLGREAQALERFRQAVLADAAFVLPRSEFSPRLLDLYQSAGGQVEAPPKPKKKLPWIIGGLVGVGAPVAVIATRKEPSVPPDPWAELRVDDDGDGLSEMQGDCNDGDPATSPRGTLETSFDLKMSGEVNCTAPFSGTEQITVTNHSCTTEWVTLTVVSTHLSEDCLGTIRTAGNDPLHAVSVAPSETKAFFTHRPGLACGNWCEGRTEVQETFIVTSSQGEERQSRVYSYDHRTCPRTCGGGLE
jgi:hypothetical protein